MRILLTGNEGFIGTNIQKELERLGHEVLGIDLKSGSDLLDMDFYRYTDIDCICHQAAFNNISTSILNSARYLENNVQGMINVLELARALRCKVVYASSSSIYNEVLSPYSLSKRMCEQLATMYYNLYSVDSIGLRYFNVFGEHQPCHGNVAIIPTWIKKILANEEVVIKERGFVHAMRDFTHVDNVVHANVLSIDSGLKGHHVFDIGIGSPQSIKTLYLLLIKQLGIAHDKVVSAKLKKTELAYSCADIKPAEIKLGYSIQTTLDQGLEKSLNYYIKELTNEQ